MIDANALETEEQKKLAQATDKTREARYQLLLLNKKITAGNNTLTNYQNQRDALAAKATAQKNLLHLHPEGDPLHENVTRNYEQTIQELEKIDNAIIHITNNVNANEKAVSYWKGQLTTRLNNQGEVFKEIIEDVKNENNMLIEEGKKLPQTLDESRTKFKQLKETITATGDLDIRKRVAAVTKGISGSPDSQVITRSPVKGVKPLNLIFPLI